jgi:ipoprotein LpqH
VNRPHKPGHITIGGHTRDTQCVKCTQNDWNVTIEANAENINDVYGAAGSGVGGVEATTGGNAYTMTRTAVGSDRANPGQTRTVPFEIKAPC